MVFSYTLPATGRVRDFHPLECALTGRTKKTGPVCLLLQSLRLCFWYTLVVKKREYRVNYGTEKRNVQLKIDEMVAERIIPADDSVRLLDEMIEEMDVTPLMRAYKRTGRRPATNPVTMLKILVYAIMQGIFSSRAIASACRRDVNFIWLLNGENAPNHSEIARFRSKRLSECGEDIFYQLVEKLSELGEIKYEHLFVDGTKIEANANKYSFVWKKSTTKYEIRLKVANGIP